jgi:hypothetical protein
MWVYTYGLVNNAVSTSKYIVLMTVNNKLRKIWDEAVAPQFEV